MTLIIPNRRGKANFLFLKKIPASIPEEKNAELQKRMPAFHLERYRKSLIDVNGLKTSGYVLNLYWGYLVILE